MYMAKIDSWYLERIIWLFAGIVILTGITLSLIVSPYWLILTGLVGVNLIVFSLTGFCIMAHVMFMLGAKPRLQK